MKYVIGVVTLPWAVLGVVLGLVLLQADFVWFVAKGTRDDVAVGLGKLSGWDKPDEVAIDP